MNIVYCVLYPVHGVMALRKVFGNEGDAESYANSNYGYVVTAWEVE